MVKSTIKRYESLDGLRGLCALLVCIMHARLLSHVYALEFVRNSYLFVDFFFVLSGFVIAATYLRRITDLNSYKLFVVKRIGRIWPLHMLLIFAFVLLESVKLFLNVYMGVGSGSEPFTGRFSIESLISNIFLIQSVGLHDSLTWNNPSWSISTEFIAYLLFGLVVLTLVNVRLFFVFGALASVTFLWFVIEENVDVTHDYGLFRCFLGFFLGCLVYKVSNFLTSLKIGFLISSVVELFLLLLVVAFVTYLGNSKFSLVASFLFSVVVFFFSYELGLFSKLLKIRVVQFLGVISFTIYLTHSFILTILWRVVYLMDKKINTEFIIPWSGRGYDELIDFGRYSSDLALIIYVALTCLISFFIYRFFEDPCRLRFSMFAHRKYGDSA